MVRRIRVADAKENAREERRLRRRGKRGGKRGGKREGGVGGGVGVDLEVDPATNPPIEPPTDPATTPPIEPPTEPPPTQPPPDTQEKITKMYITRSALLKRQVENMTAKITQLEYILHLFIERLPAFIGEERADVVKGRIEEVVGGEVVGGEGVLTEEQMGVIRELLVGGWGWEGEGEGEEVIEEEIALLNSSVE